MSFPKSVLAIIALSLSSPVINAESKVFPEPSLPCIKSNIELDASSFQDLFECSKLYQRHDAHQFLCVARLKKDLPEKTNLLLYPVATLFDKNKIVLDHTNQVSSSISGIPTPMAKDTLFYLYINVSASKEIRSNIAKIKLDKITVDNNVRKPITKPGTKKSSSSR